MALTHLPGISDLDYRRFANQFARPPADPLFSEKAAFFLTRIQGNNNWALNVTLINGGDPILIRGRREIDLWHPIVVQSINSVDNGSVTEIFGFTMPFSGGI